MRCWLYPKNRVYSSIIEKENDYEYRIFLHWLWTRLPQGSVGECPPSPEYPRERPRCSLWRLCQHRPLRCSNDRVCCIPSVDCLGWLSWQRRNAPPSRPTWRVSEVAVPSRESELWKVGQGTRAARGVKRPLASTSSQKRIRSPATHFLYKTPLNFFAARLRTLKGCTHLPSYTIPWTLLLYCNQQRMHDCLLIHILIRAIQGLGKRIGILGDILMNALKRCCAILRSVVVRDSIG